jgi:predicted N-acyltransferase
MSPLSLSDTGRRNDTLFSTQPFDVQVAHSIEEIGPDAWDRLGRERAFASHRWYRFGERVLADTLPIYIILSQRGEPIARGTFWLTRQEPLPISSLGVRRLIEILMRRWPLLICRTPLTGIPGLILPEPPLYNAALKTIVQVAQEQARQHQASFIVFDYLGRCESKAGWPPEFNSAQLSEAGTRLPITWPDFESYLKQLSRVTQRSCHRNIKHAADLGLVVTPRRTVTVDDRAMSLIRSVERHHRTAPNPWARAMLENASLVDATWLTAEIDNQLVGCALFLGDGDTRFATLLGLDYRVEYVYFQILYAVIRRAIEEGARVLRGGSGAYEIKQRMGFCLEDDNYVAFAAQNRMLQWLGKQVSPD